MSSFAQASKLIDNRIQFSSSMGYIVEKFIVPKGKTCVKSISTETMDKNGVYTIAISNIEEPPSILYNKSEWYEGNNGTILLDLTNSPIHLASGMEIMLYVMYMTGDLEAFSVPVSPGGTEIGHNEIHDPFSQQLPPISEPGYKAFTLEYGCDPGNIDGEDTVALSDAILSLKILAGFQPDYVCLDADVNGDRRIGVEELIFILEKLSSLK
jgi:hypothetical protein